MLRDCASISTTSLSGIVYLITCDQFVSAASTINPTLGGAFVMLMGVGCGGASADGMRVVRFPDSAKAAYTFVPSGLRASARGLFPRTEMADTSAWLDKTKTRMRLLREQLRKARPAANTTSAGSSFAWMVSVTMPRETETMLTLSETSLTTQASSLFRGFTDTG